MSTTVLALLSRKMVIEREMYAIANTIANASNDGFKSERMMFAEYLQDIGNNQTMAFIKVAGVIRDFTNGPIRATGNPLDIAIRGEGFLTI